MSETMRYSNALILSNGEEANFTLEPSCAINFFGPSGEAVFWISPDGKIHVDPDAPADETAKKVCEILSGMSVRTTA